MVVAGVVFVVESYSNIVARLVQAERAQGKCGHDNTTRTPLNFLSSLAHVFSYEYIKLDYNYNYYRTTKIKLKVKN